jgi:carbonic anhydrase
VESLLATELRNDPEALVRQAVRSNVRVSVSHLRHGSEILEQLIQKERLLVVGAEYSLETGVVDFFEGVWDEVGGVSPGGRRDPPLA